MTANRLPNSTPGQLRRGLSPVFCFVHQVRNSETAIAELSRSRFLLSGSRLLVCKHYC